MNLILERGSDLLGISNLIIVFPFRLQRTMPSIMPFRSSFVMPFLHTVYHPTHKSSWGSLTLSFISVFVRLIGRCFIVLREVSCFILLSTVTSKSSGLHGNGNIWTRNMVAQLFKGLKAWIVNGSQLDCSKKRPKSAKVLKIFQIANPVFWIITLVM